VAPLPGQRVSSKRRVRRAACSGKVKHKTEQEARRALSYLMRGPNYDGQQLVAYRCQFCRQFHLGHVPYAVRQAIEARRASR